MTGNSEFINFNVSAGASKKNAYHNNLTLKKLHLWIENKGLDVSLTNELKKMSSKYPHQALENWKNNYTKHLSQARKNLRTNKTNTNLPMTEEEFLNKNKKSDHLEDLEEFN